ncbi:MAG: hypothetical protein FWE28_09920 [Oscillospiraceae bacterium]|nr:hypothetical protein [Oscillospiraceae bacterium]
MFQTASGVTIPFPERIKEEFQVFEKSILLNVSFEKLKPLVEAFLARLIEPLFFVLEIPLSQQEESEHRKNNFDPFHKKVCYLDGLSKEQINAIFRRYGTLLFNDGGSQFAIASHTTKDEIYVQKYKITSIFSNHPATYIDFLKGYGFVETDNLITAWDTFSHETPGEVRSIEVDGTDIFDAYDEFVKLGMYVAKIAED